MSQTLTTERLVLRPWQLTDAEDLYLYAKDPRVGPIAGWPVHQSVEESAEIIKNVFQQAHVFAVELKETAQVVGCIGLLIGEKSNFDIPEHEGELAYWIGVPHWGKGLIPEAIREVMRYAFQDVHLTKLWCGYFDGNQQSKIAQEKCGFRYDHSTTLQYFELIDEHRIEHLSCIEQGTWQAQIATQF